MIAFIAPVAIIFAIQNRIPQSRGAEYEDFNNQRGRISGAAAFGALDTRAPELCTRRLDDRRVPRLLELAIGG